MTHKELLRLLESEGWVLRRAKTGTHMTFRKEGVTEIGEDTEGVYGTDTEGYGSKK
jgi:hypothetical protein